MSDSYIQVPPNSTGEKLQSYKNTVGANSVHAEAMVIASTLGVPIPDNEWDEIQLGYTGLNLTTVTFKKATATIVTLTLAYTGNRLDSVVKS